jgi:hypothetical protein
MHQKYNPKNNKKKKSKSQKSRFLSLTFFQCTFSEIFLQIWNQHEFLTSKGIYFNARNRSSKEYFQLFWPQNYKIRNTEAEHILYFGLRISSPFPLLLSFPLSPRKGTGGSDVLGYILWRWHLALSSVIYPVATYQCRGGRLSIAIKSWPETAWHHSSLSISKEDFMKALTFNGFVYNYFATEYNRREVWSRTGVIRKSFCCSCYSESINSFNRPLKKNHKYAEIKNSTNFLRVNLCLVLDPHKLLRFVLSRTGSTLISYSK